MRETLREELENKKLALEISELKKKWYERPSNYIPLLTLILTISTILWTFSTGVLDIKYQTLTKEKKSLELDIKEFETTKSELIRDNNAQHIIADSLKKAISILKQQKEVLSSDVGDILSRYKNESSKVSALIKKISDLNIEFDKKVRDTTLKSELFYQNAIHQSADQYEILREEKYEVLRKLDACKYENSQLELQIKDLRAKQN
jgi:hypothetical protein